MPQSRTWYVHTSIFGILLDAANISDFYYCHLRSFPKFSIQDSPALKVDSFLFFILSVKYCLTFQVSLLRRWKQIDVNITESANEAKDNVKYLYTLERFIDPLYTGNSETITDTLPALMNSIKMIHTIARYYNTSERMTSLFAKITEQMIANCKMHIIGEGSVDALWESDPQGESELESESEPNLDSESNEIQSIVNITILLCLNSGQPCGPFGVFVL